jgi:glutaminyl-peptide cyclotransferase
MKKTLCPFLLALIISCNNNNGDNDGGQDSGAVSNGIPAPAAINASVVSEYPHDTSSFTEGLLVHDSKMYEGTGMEKHSAIKVIDLRTGKVEKKFPVKDNSIFGEGISILNGKLYQLTYQNHLVFVYDLKDLSKPIKTFSWQQEGWGMTNNGKELIISDGKPSGNLYFVNPEDFRVNRILQVRDNIGVLSLINELEYIDGYVYANLWGSTKIIKIDPSNGYVVGALETANMLGGFYNSFPQVYDTDLEHVLNGIAFDSASKKIYVTGKKWPKLFEIKLN